MTSCDQKPTKWMVYYGDLLTEEQLNGVALAILEPAHIAPKKFPGVSTKFIGYVSIGEAEEYRPYWFDVMDKDFLVSKNPNWPKNHLVDIRSPAWQKMLLEKIIPPIVNKGYHGLFLDTIDTAVYLETTDPVKFKGSKQAMIAFIKKLKQDYPSLTIITNNGLELLMDFGRNIDGVVVEDLYTRHDFKTKKNIKTPKDDMEYKEAILSKFTNYYNKPVYNILYADSPTSSLAKFGIARSASKGYNWYVTTVDLMKIGTMQ
ncbi:MAG: endo alpha-1,4 polygalactosaminidase [Deltaproteobacteria bacterium]|nr:endo alpha-1,4 polygalactosaminidase [Deltaproteobacteria bacterium]